MPPHQESSPPPLWNPRSQTSPLGGSDPVHNDSPSADLNIPSTPIIHNYRATVEDVSEDEDEDEDKVNSATSRRSSSYYSNRFHFGEGPPDRGSSPSGDNLSHHPEPTVERTYHPHLTGSFLFYFIILFKLTRKQVCPVMCIVHLCLPDALLAHLNATLMLMIGCPIPVENNLSLLSFSTPRLRCQWATLVT